MIAPAKLDLRAGRHVPLDYSIAISGLNLTGATAAGQVRLTGDTAGSPIITFAPTISVDTSGAVPVSTIRLQATKTAMEAMPAAPSIGDDAVFAWDLQVTQAGAVAGVFFRGAFIVEAGVTQ